MNLLPIKTKVEIIAIDRKNDLGTIVGYGTLDTGREDQNIYQMYLVELNVGFWNQDETIYVRILPVHHENVKPV